MRSSQVILNMVVEVFLVGIVLLVVISLIWSGVVSSLVSTSIAVMRVHRVSWIVRMVHCLVSCVMGICVVVLVIGWLMVMVLTGNYVGRKRDMVNMLIVVYVLELIVIGSDWTLMVASNMDMIWIFVHMGNCVVSRLRMVDCVSVHVVTV